MAVPLMRAKTIYDKLLAISLVVLEPRVTPGTDEYYGFLAEEIERLRPLSWRLLEPKGLEQRLYCSDIFSSKSSLALPVVRNP
jgi:hypothetical protein